MSETGMNALGGIANKTSNDILLLTIVVAIVAIIVAIPLYKLIIKSTATRRQQEINRECKLLDVIEGNSTVMAELKTLLTSTNTNCNSCKTEQLAHFQRLEDTHLNTTLLLNAIDHNIQTITSNFQSGKDNCVIVLTKLESLLSIVQNKDKGGKRVNV